MSEQKKENPKSVAGNVADRVLQDQMMNVLVSAVLPGAAPMVNIMQKGYLKATTKKLAESVVVETAQELTSDNTQQQEPSTMDAIGVKMLLKGRGQTE